MEHLVDVGKDGRITLAWNSGRTGCPDIKLLNMAQGRFYWLELAVEH